MFVRGDGRFQMERSKVRRRAQQYNIDAAGDDVFVGVKANELALGRKHLTCSPPPRFFSKLFKLNCKRSLECIAHRR